MRLLGHQLHGTVSKVPQPPSCLPSPLSRPPWTSDSVSSDPDWQGLQGLRLAAPPVSRLQCGGLPYRRCRQGGMKMDPCPRSHCHRRCPHTSLVTHPLAPDTAGTQAESAGRVRWRGGPSPLPAGTEPRPAASLECHTVSTLQEEFCRCHGSTLCAHCVYDACRITGATVHICACGCCRTSR